MLVISPFSKSASACAIVSFANDVKEKTVNNVQTRRNKKYLFIISPPKYILRIDTKIYSIFKYVNLLYYFLEEKESKNIKQLFINIKAS